MRLLLDAGAAANGALEDAAEPPLMLAVRSGALPSVQALLAHGADPASDRALELRADRTCSVTNRQRLARALERVVRDARQPAPLIRPQVPVRRAAIRDCAQDLEALIRRLRDGEPVDPRGIALTDRLLTDGASPLYYDAGGPSLSYTIRSARLALDPLGLDLPDVPAAA